MSIIPTLGNPLKRLADFNDLTSADTFVVTCEITENNYQLYLTFSNHPKCGFMLLRGDFLGTADCFEVINRLEVLTCICLKSPFKLTLSYKQEKQTLSIVFKPTNVTID